MVEANSRLQIHHLSPCTTRCPVLWLPAASVSVFARPMADLSYVVTVSQLIPLRSGSLESRASANHAATEMVSGVPERVHLMYYAHSRTWHHKLLRITLKSGLRGA